MTVAPRKFLVLRTCADDDFLIVGDVQAPNETEAMQAARRAGLVTRRGSFLVVLDETGYPPDKQTYRVNGFGRVVWIITKDTLVDTKPGSGPRRDAA